jgi:hypothetical protein
MLTSKWSIEKTQLWRRSAWTVGGLMEIKLELKYLRTKNIKGEEDMGLNLVEGLEEVGLELLLLRDLKGSYLCSVEIFKELIIYNLL